MVIGTSNVSMTSTRKYSSSRREAKELTKERVLPTRLTTFNLGVVTVDSSTTNGAVDSGTANGSVAKSAESSESSSLNQIMKGTDGQVRFETLRYLMIQLFFKRMSGDFSTTMESLASNYLNASAVTVNTMDSYYSYSEEETTTVSTSGKVQTADGRTIDFGIEVGMSRKFYEEYTEEISWIQNPYMDPLVINLDTDATEISDQKFYFDLNSDGTEEYISKLGTNSGFLVLDRNDDGLVNDGSELFGTKSGDGFEELAFYDEDGNGWIDEADSIFSQLKVWCMNDDSDEGELYTLKDTGVGAIYLEHVASRFSLNDENNDNLAQVRSSGIFLYEDGRAGNMQQVDMALFQEAN